MSTPPRPLDLACVRPTDPEFEKESAWNQTVGERLERELVKLQHCAPQLLSGDSAQITLRLVYGQDGSPLSQHVVGASAEACGVAECLKTGLATVHAPKLLVEQSSHDLTLRLQRGQPPRRVAEPTEPLAGADAEDPAGCVDPAVAQLSRAKVHDIVRAAHPALSTCYSKALVNQHHLEGAVSFEFVIGREGTVEVAEAREASLADCAAIACMLEQFRALHFPPPVGRPVRVIYPVRYTLEQPPVSLR